MAHNAPCVWCHVCKFICYVYGIMCRAMCHMYGHNVTVKCVVPCVICVVYMSFTGSTLHLRHGKGNTIVCDYSTCIHTNLQQRML